LKNYYDILALERNATPEQIKAAYYQLARENNPGLHPGEPAYDQLYADIEEAYDTLRDEMKRGIYDRDLIWAEKQQVRQKEMEAIDNRNTWKIVITLGVIVFHLATCSHDMNVFNSFSSTNTSNPKIDSMMRSILRLDSGIVRGKDSGRIYLPDSAGR